MGNISVELLMNLRTEILTLKAKYIYIYIFLFDIKHKFKQM